MGREIGLEMPVETCFDRHQQEPERGDGKTCQNTGKQAGLPIDNHSARGAEEEEGSQNYRNRYRNRQHPGQARILEGEPQEEKRPQGKCTKPQAFEQGRVVRFYHQVLWASNAGNQFIRRMLRIAGRAAITALARWLRWFFSRVGNSAMVTPTSCSRKTGS